MDSLRAFINWITKHRFLSILIAALFVGGAVFLRTLVTRSEGTLTEPLRRGTIVQSVYGIGTVTANQSYQIKPGVISTISELFVKEGDSVKKGAKLALIDRVLFRAPFDGTITLLPFKVGENVFAQTPVLTLVNLEDRYLVVSLEQQGALQVQRGQKVKISLDTIREQNYDGVVASIYSNESNFLARIDISQLPARILPGMTADVAITIQTKENVLLVPVAALEQGNVCWVKRGHQIPSRVEIKTGIIDKEVAEVASGGLQEGDRLLIRKKITP